MKKIYQLSKFYKLVLIASIFSSLITYIVFAQKNDNILYPVEINGKYGYINKSGKVIIKPQYDNANDFSEGLAAIKVGINWGYINRAGKIIIKPKFHIANDFHEGLAAVGYEKYQSSVVTKTVGYINKQGKFIIKPESLGPYIYDFKDGLVAILSDSLMCAFKDKSGKVVLNPRKLGYTNIFDGSCIEFSEGLLPVEYNNGYGYINKQGKLVIKTQAYLPEELEDDFIPLGSFSYGIAAIQIGQKLVFIDKTGKVVNNSPLETTEEYSDGLTDKYINGKYGYADITGKIVIKPQFNYAEPFNHGLARVVIGKKHGYIDKTGRFIWSYTGK